MSCTSITSLYSYQSSANIQPGVQFKKGVLSKSYVKTEAKRKNIDQLYESQWSLHSGNSLSTEDLNLSLQPNYLKMMNDTNLMDNCAAAKVDIESISGQVSMDQLEFLEKNKAITERTSVNMEQLEQWIIYMDKYLSAFAPNWKQVNEMDVIQRNKSLYEQRNLRQYIASHNQIFNQMVKEEDNKLTRKIQYKYHMLLLNAIEKQCLLEKNRNAADNLKIKSSDINFSAYKICSVDVEPRYSIDSIIKRSTESMYSYSDLIVPTDDDIFLPTTSKGNLLSEDNCSSFSSHPDFRLHENNQSLESLINELNASGSDVNANLSSTKLQRNGGAISNSLISESSLNLIENVDLVLNNKVNNWLINHPFEAKKDSNICTSTSDSDVDSTASFQWDNFQDIYKSTTPIHENTYNTSFLYFGDDYDDALKCKHNNSSLSISDLHKSSISTPVTLSKSKIVANEGQSVSCSRKLRSSKLIDKNNSEIAQEILLTFKNLQKNYKTLNPRDFDGILNTCVKNLECLMVVLDKEQSHNQSRDSCNANENNKNPTQTCQCGVISSIFQKIVEFLYDCSRKVRRSAIYKFLLKFLKKMYAMVKFLSRQVRFYRNLYDM